MAIQLLRVNNLPAQPPENTVFFTKNSGGIELSVSPMTAGGSVMKHIPRVSVLGPTALIYNQPGLYKITSYDAKITYNVTSSDGNVINLGNGEFNFVVTNTSLSQASFSVNGRSYSIQLSP